MKKFTIAAALTLALSITGSLFAAPVTSLAAAQGWSWEGSSWYYYVNGAKARGWVFNNGKWYYMQSDGRMATGWIYDGGKWYYLNPSGDMATGWIYLKNDWYYLNPNGDMATGWLLNGGKWYYLSDHSGKMLTGWQRDSRNWYFFDSSGAMNPQMTTTSPNLYYNTSPIFINNAVHITPYKISYQNGQLYAQMHISNGYYDRRVYKLRDVSITLNNYQGTLASRYFGALEDEGYIEPRSSAVATFVFPSSSVYNKNTDLTRGINATFNVIYDWYKNW